MAVTINNFTGMESGGLQEFQAISGDVTNISSLPRTGLRSLRLKATASEAPTAEFPWVANNITDAGVGYIFGFGTAGLGSSHHLRTKVKDSSGNDFLTLRIDGTNFSIEVFDANGSSVATGKTLNLASSFQYVEVYFVVSDTIGEVEVFVNGVSEYSATGIDFDTGNSIDHLFFSINAASTLPGRNVDDIYILSGASDANDRLSNGADAPYVEVRGPYQNTVEDGTDQGDALAGGTWANVGELPLSETNEAHYENTGNLTGSTICDAADSNARPGPNGDADIDGDSNIRAALWYHRLKRGTGASRTHQVLIGNDSADDVTGQTVALTTSYQDFFHVSEAASIAPLSTEHFQHGFSKSATAGQDIFCADIFAFILHVPAAPPVPSGPPVGSLALMGVGA